MTLSEFSDQFDTLLDSYKLKEKFGDIEDLYTIKLDEYEKSLFLTNAQNDIIIELYTGRGLLATSYEQTEELRRYLSNINKTKIINNITSYPLGLSSNSKQCNINDNVLYITQEQCKISSSDPCLNGSWLDTYPIRRDNYNRTKNNPFKNNKIWRVDIELDSVELISKYEITDYKVTYLRRPNPIILEDLINTSIDNKTNASECELHVSLHKYILERAVIDSIKSMATYTNNNKE